MDGRTHVTVHNGTAWSTTSTDLGGTTGSGPALTVRDGALYCAVRTLDGAIALDSFNGTAWTGWVQ
jgi:outer membrane protein assembly factor BamB